jgi:hypothetical protein
MKRFLMKEGLLRLKRIAALCLVLAVAFLAGALFSYFH